MSEINLVSERSSGRHRTPPMWLVFVLLICSGFRSAIAEENQRQIHAYRITILSTMLAGEAGLGEWGFAALVDADGNRLPVDTGSHPNTVMYNARDLAVDLSDVEEVVLTHNHPDHVRGLLTLRREMMKTNPKALSIVHVAESILDSWPSDHGERNRMIAIKKEYEGTGGHFRGTYFRIGAVSWSMADWPRSSSFS